MRWCIFGSSRRRHTRLQGDWSSDVCSSDLAAGAEIADGARTARGFVVVAGEIERPVAFFVRSRGKHERRGEARRHEIGRASCRERVRNGRGGVAVEEKG